jgi:hypothetical protein
MFRPLAIEHASHQCDALVLSRVCSVMRHCLVYSELSSVGVAGEGTLDVIDAVALHAMGHPGVFPLTVGVKSFRLIRLNNPPWKPCMNSQFVQIAMFPSVRASRINAAGGVQLIGALPPLVVSDGRGRLRPPLSRASGSMIACYPRTVDGVLESDPSCAVLEKNSAVDMYCCVRYDGKRSWCRMAGDVCPPHT